jgi:pimeloyl-ACP methyl ester carboxylesterase
MKSVFRSGILITTLCFLEMCTSSLSSSFKTEEVHFFSRGVRLSGTLVFPRKTPVHAAVVFVHGSGAMTRDLQLARRFAAEGIAALVYDKRGVGQSGGTLPGGYCTEACLDELANDAASGLLLLNLHPALKNVPVGLTGFSQAGWIVPMAAARSAKIDFIGLWSGPTCKLSEEDIYSKYTSDRDFAGVPSYEQVVTMRKEPYQWSDSLGKNIDPLENLRKLRIPGYWIFGTDDGSIPVDLCIEQLKQLKEEGCNEYQYAIFSNLGHGLINETFFAMTSWVRRTFSGGRLMAAEASDTVALSRYTGGYTCYSPKFSIRISQKGQQLQLTKIGSYDSIQLKYLSRDSFYGNDYGSGFIFLNFDLDAQKLTATQQGQAYNFQKESTGN